MALSTGRPPTVLVGFAESLAAVESVRSLLAAGHRVTVFARRAGPVPLDRQRGVRVVRITDPLEDAPAAVDDLRRLATDDVDVVLPLDDISLWLVDRANPGGASGPAVAGPRGDLARLALDKRLQLEAATAAGFAVPPTMILQDPSDLRDVRLPVVVKPALAVEEAGGRLSRPAGATCTTLEQVRAAAELANPLTPRLVQPFVQGTGEGVFGIGVAGQSMALSGHSRVRMMNPSGSGSSACAARRLPEDEVAQTGRLIENLGWSSLFMVELLRDGEGTPWFMELNGRAWGSMALARRLGHEYPRWAVQAALGEQLRLPGVVDAPTDVVCRHLGRELVHLLAVMRSGARAPGWPTRRSALSDVLRVRRSDTWYNAERGEGPAVLAADTWATVREQVARRRRR